MTLNIPLAASQRHFDDNGKLLDRLVDHWLGRQMVA
jgi:hypothetical protein